MGASASKRLCTSSSDLSFPMSAVTYMMCCHCSRFCVRCPLTCRRSHIHVVWSLLSVLQLMRVYAQIHTSVHFILHCSVLMPVVCLYALTTETFAGALLVLISLHCPNIVYL